MQRKKISFIPDTKLAVLASNTPVGPWTLHLKLSHGLNNMNRSSDITPQNKSVRENPERTDYSIYEFTLKSIRETVTNHEIIHELYAVITLIIVANINEPKYMA